MRLIALCKTWGGGEWVRAMAMSVAPYVDKIVFVNSEVSWIGRKGNTCKAEIAKLRELGDKIVSLDFDTTNQTEQIQYGLDYIKQTFQCTHLMLIDTDEVWDSVDMEKAVAFIKSNPDVGGYQARMESYIKSPFYRIIPPETNTPTCFVSMSRLIPNRRSNTLLGIRAGHIKPRVLIPDVKFHHFAYVRNDFNTVLEKIFTSHVSEDTRYTDMSVWIPEVWNRLPDAKVNGGFHPLIGHHHYWQGIAQVTKHDLPQILQTNSLPIMIKYEVMA